MAFMESDPALGPPKLSVPPPAVDRWEPAYEKGVGYWNMNLQFVPINETYFPTAQTCAKLVDLFTKDFGVATVEYQYLNIPGQPFALSRPCPVLVWKIMTRNQTQEVTVRILAGFLANIWTLEVEHPDAAYPRAADLVRRATADQIGG